MASTNRCKEGSRGKPQPGGSAHLHPNCWPLGWSNRGGELLLNLVARIKQHHQQRESCDAKNRQPPRLKHNGKQNQENDEYYPAPCGWFVVANLCRFHFYGNLRPASLARY